MSRNIISHAMDLSQEQELQKTNGGKLIVTQYHKKYISLLMKENRLLAACAMDKENNSKIGAIYIAKVKKLLKNVDACFVEIANKEACYLDFSDCKAPFLLNRYFDGRILQEDEILVQVVRDALKTKPAAVTAKISIKGRFFIITAGYRREDKKDEPTDSKISFSNSLSKEKKEELQAVLTEILIKNSENFSSFDNRRNFQKPFFHILVRTAAASVIKDKEDKFQKLEDEFQMIQNRFFKLFQTANYQTCFSCLLPPIEPYFSVVSQINPEEYQELVTDLPDIFEKLAIYLHQDLQYPEIPVRLYKDNSYSLAKLYSIETHIKEALQKKVWLKSGGYLIIEPTEALTVIDVNSGKYSTNNNSLETFYQINKEAAREIALQLRLRNLSGIIIIDFISMKKKEQQESLLQYMKQLTCNDKIITKVVDITPLGLVELTRQKKNKTLQEQLQD